MIVFNWSFKLLVIIAIFCNVCAVDLPATTIRVSNGEVIPISLIGYNTTSVENQAFVELMNVTQNSNFIISVTNVPKQVAFIVVQVHTYMYAMSISYQDEDKISNKALVGLNIGLFVSTLGKTSAKLVVKNNNAFDVLGLAAVVAYTKDDPYPGGCNMVFDYEISPFQKLTLTNSTVIVDAQPAAIPNIGNLQSSCEKFPLHHEAYRMYLPEQDISSSTYFQAISKMLTPQDIKENAELIPESLFNPSVRRVYSAYSGTGSIYGMIAYLGNPCSAYVPAVSYACDISSWESSCIPLTNPFSKIICALAFFLGLFVVIYGQTYFKTAMFFSGTLTGAFIGYILSQFGDPYSFTGSLLMALAYGILTSIAWLIFWVNCSSALPSLALSGLALGSLYFFVFYSIFQVDVIYLELDWYFLMVLFIFVAIVIMIFTLAPLFGNIICFTTLGAFTATLAIDYYIGSNLKYIIINAIRRFTEPDFSAAVVSMPFQYRDMILTTFCLLLVAWGTIRQFQNNRNRPPYPPPLRGNVRHWLDVPNNERQPLLYQNYRPQYYGVYRNPTGVGKN